MSDKIIGGMIQATPPPFLQGILDIKPVVSVSSIHVEENSGVVITNSSLSVLDQDTPENEILFTVIRVPSYGERSKHLHPAQSWRGEDLFQSLCCRQKEI